MRPMVSLKRVAGVLTLVLVLIGGMVLSIGPALFSDKLLRVRKGTMNHKLVEKVHWVVKLTARRVAEIWRHNSDALKKAKRVTTSWRLTTGEDAIDADISALEDLVKASVEVETALAHSDPNGTALASASLGGVQAKDDAALRKISRTLESDISLANGHGRLVVGDDDKPVDKDALQVHILMTQLRANLMRPGESRDEVREAYELTARVGAIASRVKARALQRRKGGRESKERLLRGP